MPCYAGLALTSLHAYLSLTQFYAFGSMSRGYEQMKRHEYNSRTSSIHEIRRTDEGQILKFHDRDMQME
jgi:hypothetical protein